MPPNGRSCNWVLGCLHDCNTTPPRGSLGYYRKQDDEVGRTWVATEQEMDVPGTWNSHVDSDRYMDRCIWMARTFVAASR